MLIPVRTFQAALKAAGFDPGPLDGIFGPRTTQAAREWDAQVGATLPDYTVMIAPGGVEVTPESVGRQLADDGAAYLAANPEEIVFRDDARRGASVTTPSSADATLAVAQPFWRSDNPWAWTVFGVGALSLSGVLFYVARRMR